MTYYFAFALAEDHQSQLDTLIEAHANGIYNSPEVISRLAIMGVDGVIKVLALDVIELLKGDQEGGKVLDWAAKLVSSTMRALLRQLLGQVSEKEQDMLVEYMLRRRIDAPHNRLFGFSLSAEHGQRFKHILEKQLDVYSEAYRVELIDVMTLFIDLTTVNCYDEFVSCLELSFVKRKLTSVARSSIIKAGHTTVKKLLMSLTHEQVDLVRNHYNGVFIKID